MVDDDHVRRRHQAVGRGTVGIVVEVDPLASHNPILWSLAHDRQPRRPAGRPTLKPARQDVSTRPDRMVITSPRGGGTSPP